MSSHIPAASQAIYQILSGGPKRIEEIIRNVQILVPAATASEVLQILGIAQLYKRAYLLPEPGNVWTLEQPKSADSKGKPCPDCGADCLSVINTDEIKEIQHSCGRMQRLTSEGVTITRCPNKKEPKARRRAKTHKPIEQYQRPWYATIGDGN